MTEEGAALQHESEESVSDVNGRPKRRNRSAPKGGEGGLGFFRAELICPVLGLKVNQTAGATNGDTKDSCRFKRQLRC